LNTGEDEDEAEEDLDNDDDNGNDEKEKEEHVEQPVVSKVRPSNSHNPIPKTIEKSSHILLFTQYVISCNVTSVL
jgi:hypothetical protein